MPFDNYQAVAQMESAYTTLLDREVANPPLACNEERSSACVTAQLAKDGKPHPRV